MLYEKVTGRRFVVSLNRPLISDVTEWLATEVTGAMVAFAWGGLVDCGARYWVRFPTGKFVVDKQHGCAARLISVKGWFESIVRLYIVLQRRIRPNDRTPDCNPEMWVRTPHPPEHFIKEKS